jgi:V/A-type H+-transporting ATPase subunit E
MSLAQITEKIRNDAQSEADEILSKAKAKAQTIKEKAEEEKDIIKSSFDLRFQKERPEILRRREIVADLDVKKMMLRSRRDLISNVYAESLKKMKELDQAEYISLSEALLDRAVSTKEEELEVGINEKFLDNAWLEAYNAKRGTRLAFSQAKPDIAGGFILTRGKISINCSWDMLVQIAQEKQESDVVKRLFPVAE